MKNFIRTFALTVGLAFGLISLPPAAQNAFATEDTIKGLSIYELEDGTSVISLILDVKPCGGTVTSCQAFLEDVNGSWVGRSGNFRTFTSETINIRMGMSISREDFIARLNLSPMKISFGVVPSAMSSWGVAPPQGFTSLFTLPLTMNHLQLATCNPIAAQFQGELSALRQAEMNLFLMESVEKEFTRGTVLPNVTQPVSFYLEQRTGVPVLSEFIPKAGLVKIGSDQFQQKVLRPKSGVIKEGNQTFQYVTFDCTKSSKHLVTEYGKFRLGVDGIILHFALIEGRLATNQSVTYNGKTYQILKNGAFNIPTSGPIKRCGDFYKPKFNSNLASTGYTKAELTTGLLMNFPCLQTPKTAGSVKLSVKETYVGSGDLIIRCRGNLAKINCTSSIDRTVTASVTGTFQLGKDGRLTTPSWW